MTWYAFFGALEQGFAYGLMVLGVYLTFRVLDFPDLTVDGSLPLGAAVSAVATVEADRGDGLDGGGTTLRRHPTRLRGLASESARRRYGLRACGPVARRRGRSRSPSGGAEKGAEANWEIPFSRACDTNRSDVELTLRARAQAKLRLMAVESA